VRPSQISNPPTEVSEEPFFAWFVHTCGLTLLAVDSDPVAARLSLIGSHLDERAWRLLLGAEAKVLGWGGIKLVAAAGGVHPDTVAQGVRELDYDEPIPGRVRDARRWR
jgi:hypothetical protein